MREKLSGIDIVGILAALLPFVFHFSSTSTRNGVSTSYFDSFGVFGGLVAIAVALVLVARHWPILDRDGWYIALVAGILIVGVYQLLHGAGILMIG